MMRLTPWRQPRARRPTWSCGGGLDQYCNRPEYRKENGELGSLVGLAANLDRPTMIGDDAVDDRKPEPGAFADGLRCEERLENPVFRLGVHAASGIDNPQANETAGRGPRPIAGDRLTVIVPMRSPMACTALVTR